MGDREFYLGTIFHDEVNPGVVKANLRTLSIKLHRFIDKDEEPPQQVQLFKDITNDEMDRLFSLKEVGN